jgi:hypothetical protein
MNRLIFFCSYIDSVKNQFNILTKEIDEQTEWIQVNQHADAVRFQEH